MTRVAFTPNIQRHVACPDGEVEGETVRDVLERYFAANSTARGYVLDDQGAVRPHMVVFVDGRQIEDRERLTDAVRSDSEVFVFQALSGG